MTIQELLVDVNLEKLSIEAKVHVNTLKSWRSGVKKPNWSVVQVLIVQTQTAQELYDISRGIVSHQKKLQDIVSDCNLRQLSINSAVSIRTLESWKKGTRPKVAILNVLLQISEDEQSFYNIVHKLISEVVKNERMLIL